MMIHVTGRNGIEQELEGEDGWRVMEIIRDHGMRDKNLGIKAECGGSLACATCHIYVDDAWLGKLVPPTEEERLMMVDEAFNVQENSRLSCQIIMNSGLDGLKVTLAPGTEP